MMEGFAAVHHLPSGITHLLASPAPELLAVLDPTRGAADIATILDRLTAEHELAPDGDAATVVAARLAELEAAGLVRRA